MSSGEQVVGGRLVFNGIDGATGDYLLAGMSVEEAAAKLGMPERALRAARFGVNYRDLSQTGWGVVFAQGCDPAVREALRPLLELRQAAAGDLFRTLEGADGVAPGESADAFLVRCKVGPGPVDPGRLPYYLLLVGGPEEIPFSFQHLIDQPYAVGRLCFDRPEGYARYAESVVAAERGETRRERRVVFWAPNHDPATELSRRELVGRLAPHLAQAAAEGNGAAAWEVESFTGERATKDRLAGLLGMDGAPSLLFTASHGMGFPADHPRQASCQGALLCQDWPGPGAGRRPVSEREYLAAKDVGDAAQVAGLISFHFACYSAGTPCWDQFTHRTGFARHRLALRPFVSRLSQRLAGHPRGGALAVIGHVERAWAYSFAWEDLTDQTVAFESALDALLAGFPVGAALESFSWKLGEVAVRLLDQLQRRETGEKGYSPEAVLRLWTALHDAKSYAIFGDPAVRLAVAPAGKE